MGRHSDILNRQFDLDPSCKLWLPFWKYGAEQTKIWDISGNNNHGVITGAVPYPGNPQMIGVGSTFNRGDFTATNAFFWSSLNLSAYAGTDLGSTPYYIEVLDGAGKKATGYIGAVGAEETLGSELVSNGGFADTTGLTPNANCTLASIGGGQSGNCLEVTAISSGSKYFTQAGISTIYLGLYLGSAYIKDGTKTTQRTHLSVYANPNEHYFLFNEVTTSSWVKKSGYKTILNVTGSQTTYCYWAETTGSGTILIDTYSIKRVTDPPSTAVHIVSALNGTTRNWASIESGFNPNTIASWKINSVIPSQGIGWYFDDVDDRIAHPSINFGKTHTLLYWLRSFANAKDIIHGGAANYHVAIDGTNLYYNAGATELSQAHGGGFRNSTMIGIVRSGTTVQFFKNGVQVGADQTLDANNDQTLTTLGSYDTPGTFLGGVVMEDLGFNRAFSSQEIRNYYELTRSKYGL